MPTPSNRTPVRVARGTYTNLNTNKADIQEGEICYATDQDKLYVKEGSNLVDATPATDITGKADIASPTFTGVPAAPTAANSTNTTQLATTAFVQAAIALLVDSSPDALNTLNELAAALGDDANFSTTVTNNIAAKLALAGGTLTGDLTLSGDPDAALKAATKQYVDANKGASLGIALALS